MPGVSILPAMSVAMYPRTISGPRFGAGCAVAGERQITNCEPIQVMTIVLRTNKIQRLCEYTIEWCVKFEFFFMRGPPLM